MAMNNFLKGPDQSDQNALPFICGEGVYHIVVDIYMRCPEMLKCMLPCLGVFHMTKCLLHCIRIYVKGTGLEDASLESHIWQKYN